MIVVLLLAFFLSYGPLFAAEPSRLPAAHKAVFGVLLHDRGPFSDRHESGVDPNWELQFQPFAWPPWRWIGSPHWMVGITPNFVGDTSTVYSVCPTN